MKKKLFFIRRQNPREKLKRKFSKNERTMPTNLLNLFQVLSILKTSGCIKGNIAWNGLKSYINLQQLLYTKLPGYFEVQLFVSNDTFFFRISQAAYVCLIGEKQELYYLMLALRFTTISWVFILFSSVSCL